MPTETDTPIKVNQASTVPASITLVRNILIAVMPLAAAKGWIPLGLDLNGLVTTVITAGLALYGAWKAFHTNEQKKTMEPFVPNAIAQLK